MSMRCGLTYFAHSHDQAGADASEEHSQTDEEDMGMSYAELGIYGRLRKIER